MKNLTAAILFVLAGFGLLAPPAYAEFVCHTEDQSITAIEDTVAAWAWAKEESLSDAATVPTILPLVIAYDDAMLAKHDGSEFALDVYFRGEVALFNETLAATPAPAEILYVGMKHVPHQLQLAPSADWESLKQLLAWVEKNPEIAVFRDQKGAVLVHYFTGVDNLGGLAHGFSNRLETKFSVSSMGRGILTHEGGHQLGLNHDQVTSPKCAPACGYFFQNASGTWIRDRMAYSPCNALAEGASCREEGRDAFSNPRTTYDGQPAGEEGVADAASMIAKTAPVIASLAATPCQDTTTQVCLQGRRFGVTVSWKASTGGAGEGMGTPVRLTENTAYFWFFSADNVEVVVKILDGCALNDKYWVFAFGGTNVEARVSVIDYLHPADNVWEHKNPANKTFVTQTATSALDFCPN